MNTFKKIMLASGATLGLSAGALQAETIDIGILYTSPAEQHVGSMTTHVNNMVSWANRVYRNNGLNITLNVVKQARVSSSNLMPTEAHLDLITNNSSVKNWRNSVRADMVALMGKRENVYQNGQLVGYVCGIAWVGRGANGTMYSSSNGNAYSISAVDCGYNTFIHELGHNMGLAHSRRQGDTSGGVYKYGMGHGVDNSFSTVMAYPQAFQGNVQQLEVFSDPDWYVCNNQACGETGISNSYKALKPIIDDVARYR